MTTNDIRDVLKTQIDAIALDKTTPAKLNAITNATGKVLATIKLEMEVAKLTGKRASSAFLKLVGQSEITGDASESPLALPSTQ